MESLVCESDDITNPKTLTRYYSLPFQRIEIACPGVNYTFRVTASDATYYLRLYREIGRSRADVDAEIAALLEFKDDCDVRVSKPLRLAEGGYVFSCHFKGTDRLAALFTEAPGIQPKVTPEAVGRVSAATAKLHRGMRRAFPSGRPYRPEDKNARALANLERLGPDFSTIREKVASAAAEISEEINRRTGLSLGFCHGDVWSGNVRQQGDVISFFDFDDCLDGPLVTDIARLLASLWMHDEANFAELAGAVLEGYAAEGVLTNADVAVIPALARQVEINSIGHLAFYCTMDPPSLWLEVRERCSQNLDNWATNGRATTIWREMGR